MALFKKVVLWSLAIYGLYHLSLWINDNFLDEVLTINRLESFLDQGKEKEEEGW
jgi:hypothetical protein